MRDHGNPICRRDIRTVDEWKGCIAIHCRLGKLQANAIDIETGCHGHSSVDHQLKEERGSNDHPGMLPSSSSLEQR